MNDLDYLAQLLTAQLPVIHSVKGGCEIYTESGYGFYGNRIHRTVLRMSRMKDGCTHQHEMVVDLSDLPIGLDGAIKLTHCCLAIWSEIGRRAEQGRDFFKNQEPLKH